jgi:hypothetical protein
MYICIGQLYICPVTVRCAHPEDLFHRDTRELLWYDRKFT